MSWSCRHARLLTRLLAAVIFPLLAAPAYGTPEGPSGGALEPRAPQSDVLIFESGERMSGKLKACVGNRCQLDSSSVPLATIVWIGFEEGERQTPKVEDPARDELHLRDGSVKSGHLLGISLGVVALQEGSYDRTDVAWLHLGGRSEPPKPTAEAGQEAGGDSAPASTPPPPSSGEATPTPPSSAPPPSPPPSRPSLPLIVGSGGVHRGHLWTGTIRVRLRTGSGSSAVIESRSEIKVRMREFRTLLKRLDTGKVVGEQILLDPENTVMKSDYRLDSDGEDGSFSHCKGTGTQTLAWTPSDPHGDQSSFVLVNRSKAGTLPLLGFSVARGTPLYVIGVVGRASAEYPITCNNHENRGSQDEPQWVDTISTDQVSYQPAGIGHSALDSSCTAQQSACDPEIRTIQGENGRMFGSYQKSWNDGSDRQELEVRWNICRDDVNCQEALPEPEHKDPCGDPSQQRALMDPIWNQRQLEAKQLAADLQQLKAAYQALQDNLEAWRTAIPLCAIEEIVEKATEKLADDLGGDAADLTEPVGKIATGDLSYMIPSNYDHIVTLLEDDRALIQAALGVGDPQAMEDKLADCTLPANLRAGAKAFVDAYAEVQSRMPELQKEVNDIHGLDREYWNQWHKYYQACLDYAACKKIPPTDCVPPPDQPSGPIPGQQTSAPTGPPAL